MIYIHFIVLVFTLLFSGIVLSEESVDFYPPILTAKDAYKHIKKHINQEKININNYKLSSITYSYKFKKWSFSYRNLQAEKLDLLVITISDSNPCHYEILNI